MPPPPPASEEGSGLTAVLIFLIIVAIIGIVIYLVYTASSRNVNARGITWNIVTGAAGSSDTFNAISGNAYLVTSTTATLNLQLTPPANAIGQEFAVIHGGTSTVVISVPGGNTYNLLPQTSTTFVWLSQTAFSLI